MNDTRLLTLKNLSGISGGPDFREIQIIPLGEYTDSQGKKFLITKEVIRQLITQATKRKSDIVVDYEHQTLTGNKAPAAGWIKSLVDKGKDGLWAVVDWTRQAKEFINNREYRYLSPVLMATKKNEIGPYHPQFLHSAALTNTPQIDGMMPIVNKTGRVMRQADLEKETKPMKKLLTLIGLPEDATQEQAVEQVTLLKNKAESPEIKEVLPEAIIEVLGLDKAADISEVKGTILALKQAAELGNPDEVRGLRARLAERETDQLVALALTEGKIAAAQKEWAKKFALKDTEGFKVFIAKAPVVVPMASAPKREMTPRPVMSDDLLTVAKMFGNDREDLERFGDLTLN